MPNVTTVLIVDDHVLFREGLNSLLSMEADFRVVGQADSVRNAIDQAMRLKPDLVLMDISLPDGSGLEAVKSIARRLPQTGVVVLSVHEPEEYLLEAIRVGAKGYVAKGMPFSNLLAALRAVRSGETAISRMMVNRLADELRRLGKPAEVSSEALSTLTSRELQILSHLGNGASSREIAEVFVISEHTVRVHIHNILGKLGLRDRSEAIGFARNHGLSADTRDSSGKSTRN